MICFDENAQCRKCGSSDVGTHYHKAGWIDYILQAPYDVLIRTCRRCGYRWIEEPLDRKSEDNPC